MAILSWHSLGVCQLPNLYLNADSEDRVITIFSKPGHVSWRDCLAEQSLCVAWPSRRAEMTLKDTQFNQVKIDGRETWELFYKVSYRYETEEHEVREGVGWTSSRNLNLKGNVVRVLAGELDPSMYIEENRAAASKRLGFNLKIDMSLFSEFSYMSLQHSGPQSLQLGQGGLLFGFSGSAPILLNFEAGGAITYTLPVERTPVDSPTVSYIRFEQYFVTRFREFLPKVSLRVGLGWHAEDVGGGDVYGYNALLGAELVGMVDSKNYFGYAKIGPVLNTEGFNKQNIEWMLGGGWNFLKVNDTDSWGLTGELWQSTFSSKFDSSRTMTTSISLGLRRTL